MACLVSSWDILCYAQEAKGAYTIDDHSKSLDRWPGHSWKLGYISTSKTVTVAIKGSDTVEEWVHNMAPLTLMVYSALHLSDDSHLIEFCSNADMTLYCSIAKGIVDDALAQYPDETKFDICGHSRGGLLAVFCGIFVVNSRPNSKVRIFAYGAPNLYYSSGLTPYHEILKALKPNIVWVEHKYDFVPMISNFVRATTTTRTEGHQKLDGFEHIVLHNFVVGDPHSMDTYIEGIKSFIRKRLEFSTNSAERFVDSLRDAAGNVAGEPLTTQVLVQLVETLFDCMKIRGN